jgi:hypothetical protein
VFSSRSREKDHRGFTRTTKGARLMSEIYYTKAQVDSYKRRIKELEVKLSLGRCGSCKKTCEAGILNRKVCDPK